MSPWLLVAIGPWFILGLVAAYYVGRWISKRPDAIVITAELAVMAIMLAPIPFGGYR